MELINAPNYSSLCHYIFMLGIQFSITPPVIYLLGEYSNDVHQCLRRLIFVTEARFTVEHVNILILQELYLIALKMTLQ